MSEVKVALVLPSLAVGGDEQEVISVLKEVEFSNANIDVWLFNKKGRLLCEVPKQVKVVGFNRTRTLSFFRIIWQMSRKIKQDEIDVLVQFVGNHSGVVALWASWLAGRRVKVVLSLRSLISPRLCELGKIKRYFYGSLINVFYPFADLILAVSEAVKIDVLSNFRKVGGNVCVVPSLLSLKMFKNGFDKTWSGVSRYGVLYVGRLVEQKRVDLLLRGFEMVQKRIDCKLTIVGDGPLRGELEDLAVELGIKDRVEFLGFRKKPYKYMRQAEVFVLTSEIEGCPHVLLEAMACSLPVVCTEYPGVSEIVKDGETGLITGREPEEIAEGIVRVLEDRKLANNLAIKAFEQVKEYDISEVIKKYEEVFRKVVSV